MDNNFDYEKAHKMYYKMMLVKKAHRKAFEGIHDAFGIHPSQHRLLMFINRFGQNAPSQKNVADHFEISAPAVAVSVKKLEDAGFIRRKIKKNDVRYNELYLTKKGKEIVEMSNKYFAEGDRAMFGDFTDEDYDIFNSYLERLMEGIKKYDLPIDEIKGIKA